MERLSRGQKRVPIFSKIRSLVELSQIMFLVFLLFVVGLTVSQCNVIKDESCSLPARGNPNFPPNFSFGVATAAYQIEGGWNADGKGSSIWDDFSHKYSHLMDDGLTGDIAADSYHRFDQDLEALKELKVNHYRFSISWARIYPTGDISSKNQKGIDYYNDVINKLLENGIQPMVTMFHFDLPYELQKLGGSANPLVINYFVTYAIELFKNYGDRVKSWITFNEPLLYCKSGYGDANYPPLINSSGVIDYICVENTLKAHAAAYRAYKSKFFENQGGRIGIAFDNQMSMSNDTTVADRAIQFNLGLFAHPIFSKSGGYPEIVAKTIERNSLKEGRQTSRLPRLDNKWKNIIQGSADFLGLNYYTSRYVERASKPKGQYPSFERDYDCEETTDPKWKRSVSPWLYCVPEGLESNLKFIRDEYDNVEVIITENGWSDKGGLDDFDRIQYLKSHLQAVLNAINDGCNVSGYSYWSLIDTFEWRRGYTIKFGLYSVNMTSAGKERTPRRSASYYRRVIETSSIPADI